MQGFPHLKSWLQWLLALVCGVLLAGIFFRIASPPRGHAITLLPPPTPAPLVVHVEGAVQNPGLYELAAGSRLQDAIDAAGGLQTAANLQMTNLAGFLEDGQRVFIPTQPPTPAAPEIAGSEMPAKSATLAPIYPLNLNFATQAELESLPGIGPTIAQRIIEYRESHGGFRTVEEIKDVKGIGEMIFSEIKDLITVE